jgi:tetratricopeptide (TPR) repeat protein
MNQQGRLQDLRDFTVQICHSETKKIAGTGILVARDKVLTCAHVLCDAGINPKRGPVRGVWDLIFGSLWPGWARRQSSEAVIETESVPYVSGHEKKAWRRPAGLRTVLVRFVKPNGGGTWEQLAELAEYFTEYDDDVVLLQLLNKSIPVGLNELAELGSADESHNNSFRSYGYPEHEEGAGGISEGTIQGAISPPTGARLQADPLQLRPVQEIKPGMSGAALLDLHKGLVVGVVTKTKQKGGGKYEHLAWATNARVLSLAPLKLKLQEKPGWLRPVPYPQTDIAAACEMAAEDPGQQLHDKPKLMQDWVGRSDLLASIDNEWAGRTRRVVALIGFGGEGKSYLASRWVDALLERPASDRPAGVFWWTFNTPDVDQFFEATLTYMTGGRSDLLDTAPAAGQRAHMIAAMLRTRRYLFVLDGIEVLQHQEADRYGELVSNALREFLSLFATPQHDSFCLITSRAPLVDLTNAREYTQYGVEGLTANEGHELLRNAGVIRPDSELDRIVATWSGHALTLSLIGSYLADQQQSEGDIPLVSEIPALVSDETRYKHVRRVLSYYDEQLTDAERAFLMIFSAFRTPVPKAALARVFREDWGPGALNAPIAALDDVECDDLLERQVRRRVLRHTAGQDEYVVHPLIRDHYYRLAEREPDRLCTVHERLKEYYLSAMKAGQVEEVSDLSPLIEAVYHACRAGAYDEGYRIYRRRIEGDELLLSQKLNAYDAVAALVREFFPRGDTGQAPVLSDPGDQRFILNRYGVAMMNTGRLRDALAFYKYAIEVARRAGDLLGELHSLENLSELHTYLGPIPASEEDAHRALMLARQLQDESDRKVQMSDLLAYQGWAAFLAGDVELARSSFTDAEILHHEIDPFILYLSDIYGVAHADFLRRTGGTEELRYARQITEANLTRSDIKGERDNVSICHRVLGDLEAAAKRDDMARQHYDRAIKIIRNVFERTVLLEALLARGRWAARRGNTDLARADLTEALYYAVAGGYGIYEADVRVALAWMYLALDNTATARAEADLARRRSVELGYHWGRVDAEEVLEALG